MKKSRHSIGGTIPGYDDAPVPKCLDHRPVGVQISSLKDQVATLEKERDAAIREAKRLEHEFEQLKMARSSPVVSEDESGVLLSLVGKIQEERDALDDFAHRRPVRLLRLVDKSDPAAVFRAGSMVVALQWVLDALSDIER